MYIAWHFAKDDYTMNYGDGRRLEVGKTYRVNFPYRGYDKPTLCEAGMHGSLRAIDALQYAPGSVCCLTEIYGNIQLGDDKLVGESRRILKMINAEDTLRHFARLCALDVIHLWNAPQVVIDYLNTGNKQIRAAWAARAADRAAAGDARAAWDAWAAARAADRAADRAAAGDARAAAGADQNKRLESMLLKAMAVHDA